jgi:predicted transposase YbfD/YdcC
MPELTQKRVLKLYRRVSLFAQAVDLRHNRGQQSPLAALLRLMVVAIGCGVRKLRDIEALSQLMSRRMRRWIGLRGAKVSDTTLYEMLRRSIPYGLRQALFEQLRVDIDRRAIRSDLFAGGVASYDGKCAAWGKGQRPNRWCQRGFFNYNAEASWRLFTLRACLTSSSARPVIDQQFLTHDGEAAAFASMFSRDVKRFPRLFRYVTGDAGLTSNENAAAVVSKAKHYLFALKLNHRWLFNMAVERLRDVAASAETSEPYRGKLVVRKLYRVEVPTWVDFAGARQFLCVSRTRIDKKGRKRTNNRFYITSVPSDELSSKRLLLLVRLHWAIENGPNWTNDVVLDEDTHCPCKKGHGVLTMSWLNIIAYNLIAVYRSQLPRVDGRRPCWRSVLRAVYHALLDWVPIVEVPTTTV